MLIPSTGMWWRSDMEFIQDELRGQYSLGYVSGTPVREPSFRRIELSTTRPKAIVQARTRYWAK